MTLQAFLVDAEKRAEQAEALHVANSCHGGEAGFSALPRLPYRHCFRLIPAVMGCQQMEAVVMPAPVGQEGIACITGALLEAGNGLFADPGENVMVDLVGIQPKTGFSGFVQGIGPEPVIHGQSNDPAAPLSCPAIREQGKGEAVGTPGHRDRKKRLLLEGAEISHAGRKCSLIA